MAAAPRSVCIILLFLFLLSPSCASPGGVSTSTVLNFAPSADASLSPLELMRSQTRVASFSARIGRPLFIPTAGPPINCLTEGDDEYCTRRVFAPCCLDCSVPEADRTPARCFCPVTDSAICLDGPGLHAVSTNHDGTFVFEFGFLSGYRCRDLAVGVNSAAGPASSVSLTIPGFDRPRRMPWAKCGAPFVPNEFQPEFGRLEPDPSLARSSDTNTDWRSCFWRGATRAACPCGTSGRCCRPWQCSAAPRRYR